MTVEAKSMAPIHQRKCLMGLGLVWAICSGVAIGAYFAARIFSLSMLADALSRYTVVLACWRKMEAGDSGVIAPSRQALAARALRASGTTAMISWAFSI